MLLSMLFEWSIQNYYKTGLIYKDYIQIVKHSNGFNLPTLILCAGSECQI